MTKLSALAILMAATATAAFAATDMMAPSQPEVIEIEVAPHELAQCRETLAQVASMPVVSDEGYALPVSASEGLPTVACVSRDA
ncbi:hypothetical protein J4E08_14485 [Sagittula sp. NFXS13]|uniref:Secreted protein n=1 Tax=Sagittula marina TaxID=943940 RepID=A0A7W6DQX5_9RHOB|nr:hypothetical protein [Sagittula marina]MBB3986081.1 hypothetical protein [Sagittula marina]